ncbi:PH domain leucine-rich repeat-containing protein phosphatase 1 [Trichinella pseudospiralis]|uniref:PH domain leucine-rich repeat-containing protein phosphatase 1 n=1 Tax=Trichinella pseudospiralis TaxID=6337 RepID=A0A0V1G2E4_TRIPS|nr:PH domain leucine-rich repeat-containing protein phosphatase 1 [Trichinella pseudospiralis]
MQKKILQIAVGVATFIIGQHSDWLELYSARTKDQIDRKVAVLNVLYLQYRQFRPAETDRFDVDGHASCLLIVEFDGKIQASHCAKHWLHILLLLASVLKLVMDNNYAPDLRPPPSDDVIAAPISKRGKERVYFTLSKWPPTYTTSQGAFSLRSTNVSRPRPTSEPAAGRASIRCKPFTNREKEKWLLGSIDRGFIRLYDPDAQLASSLVVPCSLETTCLQIASRLSVDPDDLHVQFNGDMLKRLLLDDRPLAIQNKFLASIGIRNVDRQQAIGDDVDLGHMIRFYAGRPAFVSGHAKAPLSSYCYIRKRGPFRKWSRRMCVLNHSRLLIFGGHKNSEEPEVISLSKGKAKLAISNARGRCLKLASDPTGGAPIYFSLSFETAVRNNLIVLLKLGFQLYFHVKTFHSFRLNLINGTTDASNGQHLEMIPEEIFNNEETSALTELNLQRNSLRERPPNGNAFILGWLNDLSRLQFLKRLNLSENELFHCPSCLYELEALTELHLAGNKLTDLSPGIGTLKNLMVLNLQNNWLQSLPSELADCENLIYLNLSFNRFVTIPPVLHSLLQLDSWLFSGNQIESLIPSNLLNVPVEVTRVEFRHNDIVIASMDPYSLDIFCFLTELDIRDNKGVSMLDLTALSLLQVLNCERCSIMVLRLNGNCLTELNASKNKLRTFTINPPPENLVKLDLSHNCIEALPEWMSYLTRLERVVCSHNYISSLPSRLFTNASSLQYLDLSHNRIQNLPTSIENCALEVLLLHHNDIPALPDELLSSMHRLRVLNLSQNRLVALPAPSALSELNRIQQLYLACNRLTDASLTVIARYRRLQVLDISHNRFTWLPNDVIEKLQTLQELNISGNQINILPSSLVSLPFLVTLRAHSNQICEIPNFALSNRLTLIDLALNQLSGDQTRHMIAPRLKHIDIACNEGVANDDLKQLKILFPEKSISLVDVNNEWILPNEPWKLGFSESNETGAHKSCIVQVKDRLRDNDDMGVLLGIVDSLDSFEIADTLQRIIPEQVKAERAMVSTGDQYLKYALIMSHKALKEKGQRQGASCALCHLTVKRKNSNGEKEYDVRVANCGDTEIVLCRKGEPIMLTKKFLIENSDEEYARVRLAGGIVDENNQINGYTPCSRLTGCSFLYPSVIPIPHEYVWKLADCDEFLIIANRGVWQTINYNEAVARVRRTPEPAVAAKYLQDVVQAYGYTGDVSIIVVRFNFAKTGPDPGHIFSAIPYKEKYNLSTSNMREISTGDNLPDDNLVKSSRYFEKGDCFQLKKELPEPSSTCEEDHSVTTTIHREEPAYGVVPVPSKPTINLFSAKVVYTESATASSCSSSKQDQSNVAKPKLHRTGATEHISDLDLQKQRGVAKRLAINACQARQSLRSVTKEAWLSRHADTFKKPQQPETLQYNPNPLLTSSKRKDLLKFSSTNESPTTDSESSEMCNVNGGCSLSHDDDGGSVENFLFHIGLSTNRFQLFSLFLERFELVKVICELDKIVFSKRRFVSRLVKTLARLPPAAFCTAICAFPFWNFRFPHFITSDLDEFVEIR